MKKKNTKKSKPKARKSSQTYRVRNWSEYNKSLVNRGNLTVWISESAIKKWHNLEKTGKKGASNTYSDLAIEACLMLKMLYKLDYRKTQGLVNSLFILMQISLSAPDYSTVSRRLPKLKIKVSVKDLPEKINLVIDSTGIKVYGEGEWKVRSHGWSKRRTWRKLHLAIEPQSGQIVGLEATRNGVDDAEKVEDLMNQVPSGVKVEEVAADGAYDKKKTYDCLNKHGTKAVIPPRRECQNLATRKFSKGAFDSR